MIVWVKTLLAAISLIGVTSCASKAQQEPAPRVPPASQAAPVLDESGQHEYFVPTPDAPIVDPVSGAAAAPAPVFTPPPAAGHGTAGGTPSAPAENLARGRWFETSPFGNATHQGWSEPLVRWNETSGRIQGVYNEVSVSPATFARTYPDHGQWAKTGVPFPTGISSPNRGISANLANFLDRNMPDCLQRQFGLDSAESIQNIKIGHAGTKGDERHMAGGGRTSYHNVSRAIDINALEIQVAGEPKPRVFMHAIASLAHYKTDMGIALSPLEQSQLNFWNQFRTCMDSRGGGSIGCEDASHQAHMHISLPSEKMINEFNFKLK